MLQLPRRYDVAQNTTEEKELRSVMQKVSEKVQAPKIAKAQLLLEKAFHLIADVNDVYQQELVKNQKSKHHETDN